MKNGKQVQSPLSFRYVKHSQKPKGHLFLGVAILTHINHRCFKNFTVGPWVLMPFFIGIASNTDIHLRWSGWYENQHSRIPWSRFQWSDHVSSSSHFNFTRPEKRVTEKNSISESHQQRERICCSTRQFHYNGGCTMSAKKFDLQAQFHEWTLRDFNVQLVARHDDVLLQIFDWHMQLHFCHSNGWSIYWVRAIVGTVLAIRNWKCGLSEHFQELSQAFATITIISYATARHDLGKHIGSSNWTLFALLYEFARVPCTNAFRFTGCHSFNRSTGLH